MKTTAVFALLLLVCHVSADKKDLLKELAAKLAKLKVEVAFLKTHTQEQAANQQTEIDELKKQQTEQAAKLGAQHTEIDKLKKQQKVPKVAFSASLVSGGEHIFGPFEVHTTLIFKHVLTNMGRAYDQTTGIFTAPVKGAYQFQWSAGGRGSPEPIAVGLVKNSETTFKAYERNAAGYMSASQAVTLLLEARDVVFLRLWPGYKVYGDSDHVTTFSGNLLYPM